MILLLSCNDRVDNNPQKAISFRAKIKSANTLSLSNPDSSLIILNELKDILKSNNTLDIYKYYNAKAFYFWNIDKLDSSKYYYLFVARQPVNEKTDSIIIRANYNAGILFFHLGECDSAIKYTSRALDISIATKDTVALTKVYYHLSNYYQTKEQYPEALSHLLKAISLIELTDSDSTQLAKSYNSLGIIYNSFGKIEEARTAYKQSLLILKKTRKITDPLIVPTVYNNLSSLYKNKLNDYDSAFYFIKQGLATAKPGSRINSTLNSNIGMFFEDQKQYDSALFYLKKSYEIYPLIKNRKNYPNSLIQIGLIFLKQKQCDSAYFYVNSALKIAEEKEYISQIVYSYQILSKIDSTMGNYKSALKNYQISTKYADSSLRMKNIEELESLKLQFETAKKDTELKLLNAQNKNNENTIRTQKFFLIVSIITTIVFIFFIIALLKSRKNIQSSKKKIIEDQEAIAIQNEKLSELIKTKDKFFSIISHDLRGPFHSQIGLLDMMLEDYNSFSDEERYDIIHSIRNTSQNSFELLNMLLEWSRAQRGLIECIPETINCYDIIEKSIESAIAHAKEKDQTIYNNINKNAVVFADQKLINTIFNNLINNSIKFTPIGGSITISMEEKPNEFVFCVTDTGIGMPQEKADKIFNIDSDFKRKGTSNEPSTGLGLVIVNEFVTLLKGKIWAISEVDKGSSFYLSLPKVE